MTSCSGTSKVLLVCKCAASVETGSRHVFEGLLADIDSQVNV